MAHALFPDITKFDVQRVWDDAKKLLAQVGMHVGNPTVLRHASGRYRVEDGRVFMPEEACEALARHLRSFSKPAELQTPRLDIYPGGVHFRYVDPESGEEKPWTFEALHQHTRFLRRLAVEGRLDGGVPGYPMDVAPELQLLSAYYLRCLYFERPGSQGLSGGRRAVRYAREIAEAMGEQHSFWLEPISPMSLHGDSVDECVQFYEPGMFIGVDPMPVMGSTAPLDWHAGWSQSVAENVGTCLLVQACGMTDFWPTFRLFLPNFATGVAYFNSPLHLTGLLTRREVHRFFGMEFAGGELLLVPSHKPDQQAAAEKAFAMAAGAMLGFTNLEGAGALNLDVIFSARQLMIDLEIRDMVRAMFAEVSEPRVDTLAEVREGVRAGSFFETDLTLDDHGAYFWRPRLFELGQPSASSVLERAGSAHVRERAAEPIWELGGEKREELERIMARARAELG